MSSRRVGFTSPVDAGQFAFARIQDNVHLIQLSEKQSPTVHEAVEVKLFRHEFVTLFRLSETKTMDLADISVIEVINCDETRYEEDTGTVFLAKELMETLRCILNRMRPRPSGSMRPPSSPFTFASRRRAQMLGRSHR